MHDLIIEAELFKSDQVFGFVDIYSLATALLSKYSHDRNILWVSEYSFKHGASIVFICLSL